MVAENGYLALFKGNITGELRNPISGKVYPRREVMDFYRSLLNMACSKPIDMRTIEMLEMVRTFLDIPSDIHIALLMEVRDLGPDQDTDLNGKGIREDMEASLDLWMREHRALQNVVRDLFEEFKGQGVEMLSERTDISLAGGMMEDMVGGDFEMDPLIDLRKEALLKFQKRYVKP